MTTVEDLETGWAAWRAERQDALRDPHGWLSITALHWLDATPRSFPGVPGEWSADGTAARQGDTAFVLPEAGSTLVDGADGVKVEVVLRTGRYGLRVRDPRNPDLAAYQGVPAFDFAPEWVVDADFHARAEPIVVGAARDGLEHHLEAVGVAEFAVAGQPQRLVVTRAGDRVQVLFHDATNGDTTAPWRTLFADPPRDGRVRLDFNRALNLPSHLTPYGTCPRPPEGNVVTVAVEAGERRFR
ncbi:DUF1684 domain-containing protein [Saccharothrix sp. NPDC042600]|uniref:DUF1684 domain-containing protein n=1 Tax=Saccharothrix TaxID=2071 RepID=UPI0034089C55|nr:DUF1684 domain-containing protein [Saccharothrix mutabilis subsp. capreolus]